ncbi:MAG: hypothetical protein GKR95_20280 [Gammaproteobacteria bacterium]|nr:hypothetical protein [Gammaproteobacteria bacterium]
MKATSLHKSSKPPQVPMTIIGGFLGTGKTTLLNHVLSHSIGIRYGVMVNDFGSLAIDESLVAAHNGDTISFANGCVCCAMGDNLVASIDKLLASAHRPEHFLVEVSGVANPKALADVATLHPELSRDLIVTLVDAATVGERLSDPRLRDTIMMQLAPADLIVLNKCDLANEDQLQEIQHNLTAHHKGKLVRTINARLPDDVLSQKSLQPSQVHDGIESDTISNIKTSWTHDPEAQFHRATLDLPESMDSEVLTALLRKHQPTLLRAKGFVNNKMGQRVSIQLSGKRVDISPSHYSPPDTDTHNPEHETPAILVVIGLDSLDRFRDEVLGVNNMVDEGATRNQRNSV